MSVEQPFHAVLLFPHAIEALGPAISGYLRDGDLGPHIVCKRMDATGPFFEMVFDGRNPQGQPVEIEVMVPHNFIRMVMSVRGEEAFGFHQRTRVPEAVDTQARTG